MKWAVYWDAGELECFFCKSESEALEMVKALIEQQDQSWTEECGVPNWDITLLAVIGTVIETQDGFKLVSA